MLKGLWNGGFGVVIVYSVDENISYEIEEFRVLRIRIVEIGVGEMV